MDRMGKGQGRGICIHHLAEYDSSMRPHSKTLQRFANALQAGGSGFNTSLRSNSYFSIRAEAQERQRKTNNINLCIFASQREKHNFLS